MKIITIVGPTAVGKTRISIALAKIINGEIISADSRQIYKYLDIGTAKPSKEEQNSVPFHLIDFIEPDQNYSCGQFARDAETKINEIRARNHIPIICGGTGLYIKALFQPLNSLPQSNKKIKARLNQKLKVKGLDYLYQELQTIDPQWAKKLNPNDKQRILRGLEVFIITGQPLSLLLKEKNPSPKFQPYYIGLNISRSILYKNINERFDRMIEHGLIDEVKSLLNKGFSPDLSALRTIGYKEIIEYLHNQRTLYEAREYAKQRTRNFAKRQLTWFNKLSDIIWYDPGDERVMNLILYDIKKFTDLNL